MKKILNILLGILMAITVVLMVYAIATGGSDASISVNLMWGYFLLVFAVALGHLLRIVEQRIVKIRRKDHRRRKHRPGQTPPPGLVAPRLPELVLILVFQHRSKVRKYSGFFR